MDETNELEAEARQLLNDPAQHIERLRQIHSRLEVLDLKRSLHMDDQFIDTLSEEERADFKAAVDKIAADIASKRTDFTAEEAAELAALPRGQNNALLRMAVRRKYSEMRQQQETPPVDPDILAVKDDPGEAKKLYNSRLAKLKSQNVGTVQRIRERADLRAEFRNAGLEVE